MQAIHIKPRFCETDLQGHIGNTAIPVWLEEGRYECLCTIRQGLTHRDWPFVLIRIEIEHHTQLFLDAPVTIKTGIEHIGNSSLGFRQEIWQSDRLAATSHSVMACFSNERQRSCPIPPAIHANIGNFQRDYPLPRTDGHEQ